jgi:GT2 family glycosyltransferase
MHEMLPRVSVLLPYRDAARTIEEAIDSIVAQHRVTVELIAVDDGSQDDGPARVARLAGRHRAVIALSSPGRGLVAALGCALGQARADVIARMDGDDVSHPERLARQLELLAGNPRLGAVGTGVEAFPASAVGAGMNRYIGWLNQLVTPADHAREIFIESPLCHPSVAIRRQALVDVGPWRECGWPEDYDLWLRMDAAGWQLAKVPEVLLRWRHHDRRATLCDPRYRRERFIAAKAEPLARRLCHLARPWVMWGAGRTGKRLARALAPHAARPACFIDIDERKLGRRVMGQAIVPPDQMPREHTAVVAVGALGARDEIRSYLAAQRQIEGNDYLCAA